MNISIKSNDLGQPSDDPLHPDFVPSLNLGYEATKGSSHLDRFQRTKKHNRDRALQVAEDAFVRN